MNKKNRTIFVIGLIIILFAFVFTRFGCSKSDSEQQYNYGVFIGADSEDLDKMTAYNIIVIDAQYFTKDDISKLKNNGHIVYTYLNIGSLEVFRDYYEKFEDITLDTYEHWEDEKWIDVSNPDWQSFIISKANKLILKGIDGFFVDNCDVYYQYPNEEIFEGVTTILKALHQTNKYVLINGGDTYVTEYIRSFDSLDGIIDGINQETVFSSINWDDESFFESNEEDRAYFIDYIETASSYGADIYLLEYTVDQKLVSNIKSYCNLRGYNYYISDSIQLD